MIRKMLRCMVLASGLAFAGAAWGEVTFYEREDFRGRSFTVAAPVDDFSQYGFNNRASSAVVREGRYLVCEHAGFQGHCVTLVPGNYPRLTGMGLNNRISSARPARVLDAGLPRAVLFEQPNLRGRSFAVEGNQSFRDLAGSGFNNRMSSLRVERGTWQFCTAPDYAGACATFGPGDYLHLPLELDNRISSGRPVAVQHQRDDDPSERRGPRRRED